MNTPNESVTSIKPKTVTKFLTNDKTRPMKRSLLLLFFIVPFFLTAQSYTFDVLTKYKRVYKGKEWESTVYSDSENQTYFLFLYKDHGKTTARLYDTKKRSIYNFNVLETLSNKEVFFDFKYVNATKLQLNESRFKNYRYEFKTVKTDSLKSQIEFRAYDSNKKGTERTIHFVALKTPKSLFHIFQFSCLHPHEFENLIPNGNYLVEYAKETTRDNENIEYKLIELKEVNFKLDVK